MLSDPRSEYFDFAKPGVWPIFGMPLVCRRRTSQQRSISDAQRLALRREMAGRLVARSEQDYCCGMVKPVQRTNTTTKTQQAIDTCP
jgi:hypothetical protein